MNKLSNFLWNLFSLFIRILSGACVLGVIIAIVAGLVLLLKDWFFPTIGFLIVSYVIGKEIT